MLPRLPVYIMFMLCCACAAKHTGSSNVSGDSPVIAKGAVPLLISNQFSFTEGPAADKWGNVFFTDQPNDKIWKYDTSGKLTLFLDKTGRANGMAFDAEGNLITCSDGDNELWRIAPNGSHTVLLKNFKGHRFNGPNDAWIHPNGGIYFTDPLYERPYWTHKPDVQDQKVYYLAKGSNEAVVAADNLVQPNGIAGTADGKYLYVADIGDNKTYRYAINKNGSLQQPQLFAAQGSDGMTLDNRGNVYLTGNGVTVYNAAGAQIQHIAIPEGWTANVCFGGTKRIKLFITASKGVYVLDMAVQGQE